MRAVALLSLLTLFSGAPLSAKPPSLTNLYPAGGQQGSTFTATLAGSFDGAQRRVWVDGSGVTITPGEKNQLSVTISKDAAIGPRMMRLINSEGSSAPLWFCVGILPELAETEPNDTLGKEQHVTKLPVCINGRLDKRGTTDLFAVDLAAGQTLTALVEAYALGSPIDPFLELRDASGTTVATAHDSRSLDPILIHTVAKAGRYSLQLAGFPHPPTADISFAGSSEIIYRLHLTTGPVTHRVQNPAVSTQTKTSVQLLGTGIPDKEKPWSVDPATLRAATLVQAIAPPYALLPIQVVAVDHAVEAEVEPNDTPAQAQPAAVPSVFTGSIAKPGDLDQFAFRAVKGRFYNLQVFAKRLGLKLDAKLTILDAAGAEVSTTDDGAPGDDCMTSFKAPADGIYRVVVGDLFTKGGSEHQYALRISPGDEPLSASITGATEYVLAPGKTVEIKGKLAAPYGYSGELTARVHGLPADVTTTEAAALKKSGQEFTLTLKAGPDAQASSQPIQVVLWTSDPKVTQRRVTATSSLRGEEQRGTTLIDETPHLWLTVQPAPHIAAKQDTPPPSRSDLAPPSPATAKK